MSTMGQTSVLYESWTSVVAASGTAVNLTLQNRTRFPMIFQVGTAAPDATDYTGFKLPRRQSEPWHYSAPMTVQIEDGETLYIRTPSPHFDADAPPKVEHWYADAV